MQTRRIITHITKNLRKAIWVLLFSALISSCATSNINRALYEVGSRETDWPKFSGKSETWVGYLKSPVIYEKKHRGNAGGYLNEHDENVAFHLHNPDPAADIVEISFQGDSATVVYRRQYYGVSNDWVACEAQWINKSYHPDNMHVEYKQIASSCDPERLIRISMIDKGFLRVVSYRDDRTVHESLGYLSKNKFRDDDTFEYKDRTGSFYRDRKRRLGNEGVYLDRYGKPVRLEDRTNSQPTLCAYILYLIEKRELNLFDAGGVITDQNVNPECIVQGKSLILHALNGNEYAMFNSMVFQGASLSKRGRDGHSLSYHLAAHPIDDADKRLPGSFINTGKIDQYVLDRSKSFVVDDYLAGIKEREVRLEQERIRRATYAKRQRALSLALAAAAIPFIIEKGAAVIGDVLSSSSASSLPNDGSSNISEPDRPSSENAQSSGVKSVIRENDYTYVVCNKEPNKRREIFHDQYGKCKLPWSIVGTYDCDFAIKETIAKLCN